MDLFLCKSDFCSKPAKPKMVKGRMTSSFCRECTLREIDDFINTKGVLKSYVGKKKPNASQEVKRRAIHKSDVNRVSKWGEHLGEHLGNIACVNPKCTKFAEKNSRYCAECSMGFADKGTKDLVAELMKGTNEKKKTRKIASYYAQELSKYNRKAKK